MRSVGSGLAAIDRDGPRADIYLSRPRKRNALTVDLIKDLTEAFRRVDADDDIRAITLLGSGDAFCAGIDFDQLQELSKLSTIADEAFPQLLSTIERARQPVVAGIKQTAPATAFELTLACDLRVLGDDATYGLIETSLGTFPQGGGTQRLPRLIGLSKAMELIYTGSYIEPDEAASIGLVHHVVDADDVDETAKSVADDLCTKAPLAVQNAKRALRAALDTPLDQGLAYERSLGRELEDTRDFREGFEARIEDRDPTFTGE
ncbi:enoyl-CoA hydratase/isomerase family protein [Halovivax gelatinilyticus]|uniref:enoyl-CoA hydratase/isomerase family protein n=1 Tax=Halovivax gelatinilyticus TaxID=2961597 RepID=UPI0020CA6EE7|nr:enoyl-CoA hydratase/isomerase family protein [Halovivax gelatinilyticus]